MGTVTRVALPAQLMTSPFFRVLSAALTERGADARALAAEFGLHGESLPLQRVQEFTRRVELLTGEPHFFVKLGFRVPKGTYGAAEYLWRSASTFRAAWEALARYERLVSSVFRARLLEAKGGRLRLCYAPLPAPLAVGRAAHEYTLAAGTHLLRELSGGAFTIDAVGFSHAEPTGSDELPHLFGVKVRYRQADNWIEFDAANLALPVVSADPALFRVLSELMDGQLATLMRPSDLVGQVEQLAEQLLSRGELDLGRVARGLRMSERTLQRRLQTEETNLRELVDAVRRRRAEQLIADEALPLSELSWRLGFSQFTAFARAYKRWTGEAPGNARARLRGARGAV